jgi:hypothetical protein
MIIDPAAAPDAAPLNALPATFLLRFAVWVLVPVLLVE